MLTHKEKGALAIPLVIENDHSLKQIQCEPLWCEHTRILGALVEHPQGNLEEIQQENPAGHPRGTCRRTPQSATQPAAYR
jgi:hypothetical protein